MKLISLLFALSLMQAPDNVSPAITTGVQAPPKTNEIYQIRIVIPMGPDVIIVNCLSQNQKDCMSAKAVQNFNFIGKDFDNTVITINGKIKK